MFVVVVVAETNTWTGDAIGGSVTRQMEYTALVIEVVLSKQVSSWLSKMVMMLKLGCAEGVVALCDGQTTLAAFKRRGGKVDWSSCNRRPVSLVGAKERLSLVVVYRGCGGVD